MTQFEAPMTRGEAVVQRLRLEIISGDLPPGEPIKDAELAQRLGVSITPIREAVAQLISEGLVEALPNKRRRVMALSMERATELMDVFGVLLVAALRRAVGHLGAAQLAAMRAAVNQMDSAGRANDAPRSAQAVDAFIGELLAAAGNREIEAVVQGIAARSHRMLSAEPGSPLWSMWPTAFAAVTTQLEADDADGAVERLERHFDELVAEMRAGGRELRIIFRPDT
ncbi:GntR family transcriptional regulator [Rhodococcus sp. T2V]|uniref:GntR family transcriptional regulator n=1 Tax=Rhodococcus sp. T2V TaxID=3034164 RepID=UPI0023E16FD1|nr:GntR family transcriptional regulator [Rhodococcus sp. T2V]MDF3312144.1 GntR family transcriptional regulator [Rhodococcus sp. T2V]